MDTQYFMMMKVPTAMKPHFSMISMLIFTLVATLVMAGCVLQPVTSLPATTAADDRSPAASQNDAATTSAPEHAITSAEAKPTTAPESTAAPEPTVYSGPPSEEHPAIALTFDDGPSTDLTGPLLDVLLEKQVKATFFVLGNRLQSSQVRGDLLRREVAEGHEVGNHTYTHQILKKADAATTRDELTRTTDLILSIAGVTPTIMRPPTGGYSATTEEVTRELGLTIVNWSWQSCPEDWNHKDDPDHIANFVIENAANGHIILLHDTNSATLAAVPRIIDGLAEKGFRFMTVSELLSYSSDGVPEPGDVVSKLK
ncbi:MAG: polysaccharide deacetylase family protein [Clostridia bacterium]|nr:polysaccharide deacetylase family protein [Clostridia bacterium]NCC74984.1 polysaccharide deacetylase family protein [Clostridia bacterium]